MNPLINHLNPKERRGSKPRCHLLTHGTAVEVAARRIWPMSTWNVSATTCATLMNKPWPISVPPGLKSTLPSV